MIFRCGPRRGANDANNNVCQTLFANRRRLLTENWAGTEHGELALHIIARLVLNVVQQIASVDIPQNFGCV